MISCPFCGLLVLMFRIFQNSYHMSIVLLKIWQSENKSIYYELSKKYNVPVKHVYKLVYGKKVKLKMNSYLVLLELRNRNIIRGFALTSQFK